MISILQNWGDGIGYSEYQSKASFYSNIDLIICIVVFKTKYIFCNKCSLHAAKYGTKKKGGDGLQKVPNCMVLDLIYLCVQFWTTVHSLGFLLCIFSSKMPHMYFDISLLLMKFRCFCHIIVHRFFSGKEDIHMQGC